MRKHMSRILGATVLLLTFESAQAGLTIQPACGGNGVTGSYEENGSTVTFLACVTSGVIHAKAWDAGGVITEVWGNMDGTGFIYQIAGETVAPGCTADQWASWQMFLEGSGSWNAATHVVG